MFDIIYALNKFETTVDEYETKEIKENMIMFYGDSAFTRWSEKWGNNNLEDDIRMKDGTAVAVNHGLGGSTADQLLYWYSRMVRPYKPKALVLKAYSNDLDHNYTAEQIVFLQSRILDWARIDVPGIKLFVCDAQPQNKEKELKLTAYYHRKEYNELMKYYCEQHDDVTMTWLSLNPELYNSPEDVGNYAKVRGDIWVEDGIHFNKEGYRIYRDFWMKQLEELL